MTMSGKCRGFDSWAAEAEYYRFLSRESMRHWRLEGHAYHVSLRPENACKSPDENWLIAEQECILCDPELRIAFFLRKALAGLGMAEGEINDSTLLPAGHMSWLCNVVAANAGLTRWNLTKWTPTVGDLILELFKLNTH